MAWAGLAWLGSAWLGLGWLGWAGAGAGLGLAITRCFAGFARRRALHASRAWRASHAPQASRASRKLGWAWLAPPEIVPKKCEATPNRAKPARSQFAWLGWLDIHVLGTVSLSWHCIQILSATAPIGTTCRTWTAWLADQASHNRRGKSAHCCRARGYTYHARSCDPAYCQESNADTDEQTNIFQDPYWCFPRQALIRFVLCVLILPCFMAPRRIALTPRTPLTRGKPLV